MSDQVERGLMLSSPNGISRVPIDDSVLSEIGLEGKLLPRLLTLNEAVKRVRPFPQRINVSMVPGNTPIFRGGTRFSARGYVVNFEGDAAMASVEIETADFIPLYNIRLPDVQAFVEEAFPTKPTRMKAIPCRRPSTLFRPLPPLDVDFHRLTERKMEKLCKFKDMYDRETDSLTGYTPYREFEVFVRDPDEALLQLSSHFYGERQDKFVFSLRRMFYHGNTDDVFEFMDKIPNFFVFD